MAWRENTEARVLRARRGLVTLDRPLDLTPHSPHLRSGERQRVLQDRGEPHDATGVSGLGRP